MKFIPTILLSFLLGGISLAGPTGSKPRGSNAPQTVHLTFNGGPASYELTFPADGTFYPTSTPPHFPLLSVAHLTTLDNGLSVSIIDAPDFRALQDCIFQTPGEQTLVGGMSADGVQEVIVGPPQPVTAVSCSGTCVSNYCKSRPNLGT